MLNVKDPGLATLYVFRLLHVCLCFGTLRYELGYLGDNFRGRASAASIPIAATSNA